MISKLSYKIDGLLSKITRMIPSTSGGPLTNKWFLYIVLLGAIYEMFSYFMRYDMYAISIFFIVGFLVSFFSKNMVVIMIMAIVFTRLIRYGQKLSAEGFEAEVEAEDKDMLPTEEEEADDEEEEEDVKEGFEKKKSTDKSDDSIVNMSDTTQRLLQNQKELMANMEALKPVLKKAESFLAASNEKKMETFTTLAKAY